MKRYLIRLQQEHRRLDRLIDQYRHGIGQGDVAMLKRLRLKVKDRITYLQRRVSPIAP